MARGVILIDGAYLDGVVYEEFFERVSVDLAKLVVKLTPSGMSLLRTYYYNCPPYLDDPPTQDQRDRQARSDGFYAKLVALPRFEVRLGRLAKRGLDEAGKQRYEQKRVDILLSVDLVTLSAKGQITDVVLVAGDSDFLPAIEAAKNNGVLIRLFHGRSPHRALLAAADERTRIDRAFLSDVLQPARRVVGSR